MNTFLTCPVDCDDTLVLGAIDVNQDCTNYPQKYSQICDLVLRPDGANAPLDWTGAPTVTAVTGEIDNADTVGGKSKHLVGEGEIQAAEKTSDEYPKRKTKVNNRLYTLPFTIKNLSDEQYEFLRQLQCGVTAYRISYANVGGHIFGGAEGIDIDSIDVDFIYSGGRDDKEQAVITITWSADGDPDRGNAPADYQV